MSRLAIFLVALMIGGSQACSCLPQTFAQKYCGSDFAVFARVENRQPSQDASLDAAPDPGPFSLYVIYTLDVTAIFKDDSQTINLGQISVKTASSSPACGVTLQIGNSYFLTGDITAQDLRLNICGSVVINLATLSSQQYLDILSAIFDQGLCTYADQAESI